MVAAESYSTSCILYGEWNLVSARIIMSSRQGQRAEPNIKTSAQSTVWTK
jgi:hypothetical protein